jgi:uncharacterized protein (DUF4415 family)
MIGSHPEIRFAAEGASVAMSADRTRRTSDPRAAAEAAFKQVTTKRAPDLPARPQGATEAAVPPAKELVSLRIDRDVLDYFQEGGPGWQDRINAALRTAAGK